MVVIVAAIVLLLVSCGCGVERRDDARRADPGTARMCELLEVPRNLLDQEHLTVEAVLTEPGEEGRGIRAGIAFLQVDDAPGAERFGPALRYVSERWNAESEDGGQPPPQPTRAVVENARALDRFLADGGCD